MGFGAARWGAGARPAGERVVMGGYQLLLEPQFGARVDPTWSGGRAEPPAAQKPVAVLPPRFSNLVDREDERRRVAEVLPLAPALEFYGPPGIGKTALFRFLAHQLREAGYPDGVIYLEDAQPLQDLLRTLFRIFHPEEPGTLADPALISSLLRKKRALILLDGPSLSRQEIQRLLECMPDCAFLLAGEESRLSGEGRSFKMGGLPFESAAALFIKELGRPLSAAERTAVQILHKNLDGHPGLLLQAAALAREGRGSLADTVWNLPPGPISETLGAAILSSLSEVERRIVAVIASLDGAPIEEEHLAEFLNLPDAVPPVNGLIRRNILQAHSLRYTLVGGLEPTIRAAWDLSIWRGRFLDYLAGWAERMRSNPARLVEAAPAILKLGAWAAASGLWTGLLRLARAAEPAFILQGRWDAWETLLEWGLQAANALNDEEARGWAMHQIGTRHLCLGETEGARTWLVRALRQRQILGQTLATSFTRHNLELIVGASPLQSASTVRVIPLPATLPPTGAQPATAVPAGSTRPATALATRPATALAPRPILNDLAGRFNPAPWVAAGLFGSCMLVTLVILGFYVLQNLRGGVPVAELPSATLIPTTALLPDTGASTETPSPSPTQPGAPPPTCGPPQGWPVYTVSPGETLASIALATGATEVQLLQANCLSGPSVAVGQQLFVPRLPGPPPTTPPPATITLTPSHTPVTPRPPDLVVTSLQAGPNVGLTSGGDFVLPVRVVVMNSGSSPAANFKLSLSYRQDGSGPEVLAPFQVPGQADPNYPFSGRDLQPGEQITFDGQALISGQMQGRIISLWAQADSCAGEANPPANCRVAESNEGNNLSSSVLLQLPLLPTAVPPTLTPSPTATLEPPTREAPQEPTATEEVRVTPEGACLDFEDLSAEVAYSISNVIITENIALLVAPLPPPPGAASVAGSVQVSTEGRAGGGGQELRIDQAALGFTFETRSASGLSLQFGDFGDLLYLKVNGEARTFADFAELNGQQVGGVGVVVFDAEGDGTGTLDLTGGLLTLEVGGASLYVDRVCPRFSAPNPG